MDPHRKSWNEQQQRLRRALSRPQEHPEAIHQFLGQHAMVHSGKMADDGSWSFEDELLHGASEALLRRIPTDGEHSIAWILWHLARIEDVTMNLLIAGSPQVLFQEDWTGKLKVSFSDTGNATDAAYIRTLSEGIDLGQLLAYRRAVGRRTRRIVVELRPDDLDRKVLPARLQQVRVEGAVEPAAGGILDYWGGLKISGLLLMPPTRHCFLHLNEAGRLRARNEREMKKRPDEG